MLTAKQESFAQAVADGLNYSDAYRHAYDAGDMKPATINDNAYTLVNHTEVAPRIQELKDAVTEASVAARAWDRDRVIDEAEVNMQLARRIESPAVANGALSIIVDVQGLKVTKVAVEVTHTLKPGLSLEELEARLKRLDALEPGVVEGEIVREDSADRDDQPNVDVGGLDEV